MEIRRGGQVTMGKAPGNLPEGFAWVERSGWWIAIRSEVREALESGDRGDPRRLADSGTKRYEGRGRPVLVALPGGIQGVLRRYRHGGVLRALTGSRFLGRSRPLVELVATERARRAGVAAPEVLAAWHRRVGGIFHEGWILTREVPGARDLVERLRDGERSRRALLDLGRETRRMHDAGVVHADLHVKNVLVAGEAVTIVDFDRSRVRDRVSDAERVGNLLRFHRSLVKLARRGVAIPATDRLRIFRGYYERGLARPERDRIAARCRRSIAFHRLSWALFGGGR